MNGAFVEGEGDAYFKRNKHNLHAVSPGDLMTATLLSLGVRGKTILDIGCANGHRLAALAKEGAHAFGIEPSQQAVAEGQKEFSGITLTQGVSHDLSLYTDNTFDIVFVSYVFHWVERKYLLRTVSEIDRVLKDGGYVVIADLYPDIPHKRLYHHRTDQEMFTYKQWYESMFIASNLYALVEYVPFHHEHQNKRDDSIGPGDNSGRLVVLRKNLEGLYPRRDVV